MKNLVNAAIYQGVWFICVFGHNDLWWVGLLLVGGHFLLSSDPLTDLKTILAVLTVGLMVDGLLKYIGLFSFSADRFPLPFWLMTIWIALATTLHHSLRWFKHHLVYAAIFAAFCGPLAYWAGVRFGAATFNMPLWHALLILSVIWACLFPAITQIARWLKPPEYT